MEVAVERASGRIKLERVACAHDCGQIINPDGVPAQVEGSILQTLSRALMEEVQFDRRSPCELFRASIEQFAHSSLSSVLKNAPTILGMQAMLQYDGIRFSLIEPVINN